MELNIEVVEPGFFEGAAADEIVASLADAVAERGRASVALAGGSTPGAVYRLLAKPPRIEDLAWENVSLFWGDERWVPQDDKQSNYRMVAETMLSALPKPGPRVFAVDTAAASPEKAAAQYAEAVRKDLQVAPAAVPIFDLVLLGVGEDGHTASLFPGSPALSLEGCICCATKDASGEKPRISLTKDVLFSARRVLFMSKGDSKAEILRQVLEGPTDVDKLPSQLYRSAVNQVTFLLDSAAARLLNRHS